MSRRSLMTPWLSCLCTAALCTAALGCNDGLGTPMADMAPAGTMNVKLSGTISGNISVPINFIYNRPTGKAQTFFSALSPVNPGLGLLSFGVDGHFAGQPLTQHYGEMQAQIQCGVTLQDGRNFESTVNSMNRLDITGITGTRPQDDGSVLYFLTGVTAGSAASTENSDIILFQLDLAQ